MERYAPRARRDAYGVRINREHSPLLARAVPWVSILLASLLPQLFIATALPLVPPTGLMMMLAWRLVRPGLLPVWAGFPLGLFDDLFSGQPMGSGVLLWSLTMIAFELLDHRIPWRSFLQDWAVSALAVTIYLLAALVVSGTTVSSAVVVAMGPQLLLSVLLFPLAARLAAVLDRLRLTQFRTKS